VKASFVIYTKPNCCLCLEAKEVLRKAQESVAFEFVEQDILADWELYQQYKEAIPVLMNGKEEWFRLRFSSAEFVKKFKAASW
jgi:glutaredoxin